LPIADMRPIVAAIDDRSRHSGGGCTLRKQTLRLAAVASEMGQQETSRPLPRAAANCILRRIAPGGHVSCSFLALVLKKELEERNRGPRPQRLVAETRTTRELTTHVSSS